MKSTSFLFAANWKMQLSFDQALQFCKNNLDGFQELGILPGADIVICPSFDAVYSVAQLLNQTNIAIGAQNCSIHSTGAYTGDVSAQSLAQLGCTYCIIGHSERRTHFGETNHDIARKTERLLEQSIRPIICIGETKDQYEQKATFDVLQGQLEPILDSLKKQPANSFCIAYEPVWSIGTGKVSDNSYLEEVFDFIQQKCTNVLSQACYTLLYGGSINENTAPIIRQARHIGGFLIGGASLDFQKFKKIVLLCSKE